jgi:Cytochrome bd terminal oxidase subunit II
MTGPVASLNTAWFALIGLLWTGYFVLEGFDFGVGMLSLAIGRDDVDRRLARNAIGPVWDGNEVWLIVAAGATFAGLRRQPGPAAAGPDRPVPVPPSRSEGAGRGEHVRHGVVSAGPAARVARAGTAGPRFLAREGPPPASLID